MLSEVRLGDGEVGWRFSWGLLGEDGLGRESEKGFRWLWMMRGTGWRRIRYVGYFAGAVNVIWKSGS